MTRSLTQGIGLKEMESAKGRKTRNPRHGGLKPVTPQNKRSKGTEDPQPKPRGPETSNPAEQVQLRNKAGKAKQKNGWK